ncbi:M50 family metallopeptidase [Granulicoccus phenolivorans]|uniref:M50 family metallopeptidase n=1 Tax=Granulicoccus phenolivorans TaxID=266854 RepID=UPI000B07A616|nr:M50 family metallopeptidase [Granulicoccus phenolivorans]
MAVSQAFNGFSDFMKELGRRMSSTQQVPDVTVVGILALVALAAVIFLWPITRMLITIIHEAGHAIVATLCGRTLSGIKLHSDTSGLTVSRGNPRGPGMVATMLAGYLFPGLVGLGAAALLSHGRAVLLLWCFTILLLLMLIYIRNWYGLLVTLFALVAVALLSWFAAPQWQSAAAYLLTWILLLAAPRPVLELARRPAAGSDAAQLAKLTRIPTGFWVFLFAAVNVVCLVLGVLVLAPTLVDAFPRRG